VNAYRDEDLHGEAKRAKDEHEPGPGVEVLPLAHQDEQHDGRETLKHEHEAVAEVVLRPSIHDVSVQLR